MKLPGRAALETALTAVGERLAHAGQPCRIVVVGGAAMNLLGLVDRATIDVDVLALGEAAGAIRPPDPLPPALRDAIAAVARDTGYASDWINTTVADQWRFGLPPDLARDLEWRTYGGGLTVGIVSRRTLVYFKLYASADQTTPDNVHTKDLLALAPSDAELEAAAAWVRTQDAGTDFHAVVQKVVDYVRAALR
ncbi:MAG: hypothetical protein A2085_00435 [Gemmatimonadetes bacterium GWC2_71_10]|nr:MAG: hypothetical protein A2085_00435 [Gemmatimonadetes bacterium GWC2_71_10]